MRKISACVFISNNQEGAFCLWESLASVLSIPNVEEVVVIDIGSKDGTWELLQEFKKTNKRIVTYMSNWKTIDAGVFASLANDVIALCKNEVVYYFQADEIPHENLLLMMERKINEGADDLTFWRYQLRENFQKIRQFPQRVHRLGPKKKFNFVGDGMNSDRCNDPPLCSNFHGGWYLKWGEWFQADPPYLPTWEMLMDVSLIGGFRDNIFRRKSLHSPFWRDGLDMPHWNDQGQEGRIPMDMWVEIEGHNDNWIKKESPFNIPKIMRGLVGKTGYYLRDDLKKAIAEDKTREYIWNSSL